MTFNKRITTAIATGAVLLNALAPIAFANTDITITGNGSNSDSNVKVNSTTNNVVEQQNTAHVTNNVTTNLSTGSNDANGNTGGSVSVKTGNANSTANVTTVANKNAAVVDPCNCDSNSTVNISGNGNKSDNKVQLNNDGSTYVGQSNTADVQNNVNTTANTGKNDANVNTNGTVTINTGSANSNVTVSNELNANEAIVGGGSGNGSGANITIAGNGSNSENKVKLNNDPSITIEQGNQANVTNDVNTNLTTGKNDANDNTGGDVTVRTGNANSKVGIDNLANFNGADVDCGCTFGVTAKIAGNGTDSENKISANLGGGTDIFQGGGDPNYLQGVAGALGNDAYITNNVDPKLKTGYNGTNDNTGPVRGDPTTLFTGDANSDSSINTTVNKNEFTSGGVNLPGNVNFSFDFNGILSGLHGLFFI